MSGLRIDWHLRLPGHRFVALCVQPYGHRSSPKGWRPIYFVHFGLGVAFTDPPRSRFWSGFPVMPWSER